MKNTKVIKYFIVIFSITYIGCNADLNKNQDPKIQRMDEQMKENNTRIIGDWKFTCKLLMKGKNELSEDFTILFKIENIKKSIHPFHLISKSETMLEKKTKEFYEGLENRFKISFDDKIQSSEICLDRNIDKSKPFIDLLIIFANPNFGYKKIELSYEDNILDCGKIIIPISVPEL